MEVILDDIIVTKSGDSNGGENCNLYGQNAALLVKDGAVATIKNAQVVSTARGASGVFSYGGSPKGKGDGTRVDIADSSITTNGNNSGGITTTGGGETNAQDLSISTSGESSAPIRSDKGGGKVVVNGGTYVSTGVDSPAVYSMADITVKDSTLISHASSGLVIRGKNKLTIQDCVLTANNHKLPHKAEYKTGIMIYDPDNEKGTAELNISGGTINNIDGSVIHVTNTKAKIVLNDVVINNSDSTQTLLSVTNDGWGGSENNATLELKNMRTEGFILVDNEPTTEGHEGSVLDLVLSSNTVYTGAINYAILPAHRGRVNLVIRQGSRFILNRTSYVDSLTNNGRIITGDYDLYVNGEKYDDGGAVHPTESSLVLNEKSYTVKDRYGKLQVTQNQQTKAITAVIKKSGHFTISGNGINTVVRVARDVKDVKIILSSLTIDNTRYAVATATDSSVILLEPGADAEIELQGTNTLIGSNKYHKIPRAIIRGNESNIVFDGPGSLTIKDSMVEETEFPEDTYPDGISNPVGTTTFKSGVFNVTTNGSAVRSDRGTVNLDGATFNVVYSGHDSLKTDDGILNIISGRFDVSESWGTGISAKVIERPNKGSVNISGGEVRLYKIADVGIRGENVTITGGNVDITNIYQSSADVIYVPGNDVVNKNTIYPADQNVEKIRINYYDGYHHGIEVGRRGKDYSYLNVPITDPDKKPGVIYTQAASGSLNISGGTVNIDTKITGLTTNILLTEGYYPCSNDVYIVGDPGHGIMSYGTVAISGGVLNINSAADGIECDGSISINGEAEVNIPSAYVGLYGADVILGTSFTSNPKVTIDSTGTAVVTVTKHYTYTYDDSRDENCHYTLDTVASVKSNNLYTYSGNLLTTIDIYEDKSVVLRSGPPSSYIKKTFIYRAIGHSIDCKGFVYADKGEIRVYGPDKPDIIPIKHTAGFLINEDAIVLVTGVDPDDKSMPRFGTCCFVQPEDAQWGPNSPFKIETTAGQEIYRSELINGGSFLIFAHPDLQVRERYSVTIGDKKYLLEAHYPLQGGPS